MEKLTITSNTTLTERNTSFDGRGGYTSGGDSSRGGNGRGTPRSPVICSSLRGVVDHASDDVLLNNNNDDDDNNNNNIRNHDEEGGGVDGRGVYTETVLSEGEDDDEEDDDSCDDDSYVHVSSSNSPTSCKTLTYNNGNKEEVSGLVHRGGVRGSGGSGGGGDGGGY